MSSEEKREQFLLRMRTITAEDPLWAMFGWLLDANVSDEQTALCQPNIGDEAAHRQRGRLSMLLDLQAQLSGAQAEANKPGDP